MRLVSPSVDFLSDSQYALGVVLGEGRALSEIPLVQLARSEARCYRLALMVATWLRTGGLQATRLLTDWRMLAAGASSIPPQPEAPFFTLADRIFWQEIKDEVDPLLPFRPGRQSLEVVELIFGSANVRTLLPAERSAASRACPPAMTRRRVDLADQLHQAGISIVVFEETRCRRQVAGLCRGFGVFAAAADQAGDVELWIRQDIMGDPVDIHRQIPRYSAGASFLMQGLLM